MLNMLSTLVVLLHCGLQQVVGSEFLKQLTPWASSSEPFTKDGLDASVFFDPKIVHARDSLLSSLRGERQVDWDFQGEGDNVLVNTIDILEQEEKRADLPRALSSSPDAPFILRLKNVHLAAAQGNDKYYTYVRRVVLAIAQTLELSISEIQPVVLLVYKDSSSSAHSRQSGRGFVVVLFLLEVDCTGASPVKLKKGLCPVDNALHVKAWEAALAETDSALTRTFGEELDPDFAPQLTPALCTRWEITGPGCRTSSYMRNPYTTDHQGLPLWFVMGVGTTSLLLCAVYPIYRIVHRRDVSRRQGEQQHTQVEALKTDLRELKRERLPTSSIEEDSACPICLVSLTDDLQENLLLPPCRHRMHACCAEGWFAKHLQCPMCRRTFGASECVVEELYMESQGDDGLEAGDANREEKGQVDRGLVVADADCEIEEADCQDLGHVAHSRDEPAPPLMPAPTTTASPPMYTISDPRSSLMSMSLTCVGARGVQISQGTLPNNIPTESTERSEMSEVTL